MGRGPYAEQRRQSHQWGFILKEIKKESPGYRAGLGWVLLYKPFEGELHTGVGFFSVIPGSHEMSDSEADDREFNPISLQPNQVIVLDGNLVIRWPAAGGGLGMMKYIKKKIA